MHGYKQQGRWKRVAYAVLRGVGLSLSLVLLGFARAFGGGKIRIEDPDRRNKVTQVEKKR
jgi:GTPase